MLKILSHLLIAVVVTEVYTVCQYCNLEVNYVADTLAKDCRKNLAVVHSLVPFQYKFARPWKKKPNLIDHYEFTCN